MKIRLYGVKKKSTMYVWMYIIYWHNLTIKQVKNSLERMSILEKNFRVQLGIVGVHGVQSQFLACTKRCLSLNRRSVFLICHASCTQRSNFFPTMVDKDNSRYLRGFKQAFGVHTDDEERWGGVQSHILGVIKRGHKKIFRVHRTSFPDWVKIYYNDRFD